MQVQTVLGPVAPKSLGFTLTHEHLSLDFGKFYHCAPDNLKSYCEEKQKITLGNVGVIKQYPYASRYNLNGCDEEWYNKVLEDVALYKKWGGGTIVENTTHGIKRNLDFYHEVNERTGVHVVVGTGHYVAAAQTPDTLALSIEQLSDLYTKEIISGVDERGDGKKIIKCGFIGEVGSNWPLNDFEKKAIKATAEVQEALGCGVSFHPGRHPDAPFEIVRLYLEAGGKAEKCVMSHLDRTIFDPNALLEFAKLGVYCQFDLFGTECSHYQLSTEDDMPSDAQRLDSIIRLVQEGRIDRILMSHDIHTKHRLIGFGGHGYSHIINNVLPKLVTKGLTDDQVDNITTKNPASWLQFNL